MSCLIGQQNTLWHPADEKSSSPALVGALREGVSFCHLTLESQSRREQLGAGQNFSIITVTAHPPLPSLLPLSTSLPRLSTYCTLTLGGARERPQLLESGTEHFVNLSYVRSLRGMFWLQQICILGNPPQVYMSQTSDF